MRKINKIVLLLILLVIITSNVHAVSSENFISKFIKLNGVPSNTFIIPEGYDFFVQKASVQHLVGTPPPAGTNATLVVYDDTTLIFEAEYGEGTTIFGTYNLLFKDTLKVELIGTHEINVLYSGFLVKEGDNFNYNGDIKNAKYYQDIITQFFQDKNGANTISIITIWVMFLYLCKLTLFWGFKGGLLFYKKHFLPGKKQS